MVKLSTLVTTTQIKEKERTFRETPEPSALPHYNYNPHFPKSNYLCNNHFTTFFITHICITIYYSLVSFAHF